MVSVVPSLQPRPISHGPVSYSFPLMGPRADLITCLLLNCHLTGKNHSCPALPYTIPTHPAPGAAVENS